MNEYTINIVECPRDAMQGWRRIIPTAEKVNYLQHLLKVGFHTLDCGSFVSHKAVPQMSDTAKVIQALDTTDTQTQLLVIAANLRGAEEAMMYEQINCIGFPFSVSPTFQQRNANSTVAEAYATVEAVQELCMKNNRQLVVYLSMAFGNPYGDDYSEAQVLEWVHKLAGLNIPVISLADTVGVATAAQVGSLFKKAKPLTEELTLGVHLHASPMNWEEKFAAALEQGCRRFDGALKGFGGCPLADDELVGNMDTEKIIRYAEQENFQTGIDHRELAYASDLAARVFVE
jgi:hydroxymethylglutaryl-CoA lyase